ncbi:MAG TPA: TolC family protein [Bryobacteraceae bacterium]|nr:TolC family protein [Bryobacteraceae bacterium]
MIFKFSGTALLLTASVLAQVSSFPKPAYFRETFSKPVTKVELQPPARLADFVVGGKLELSLRSYLELVMANNTEIQIQRLAVETPRNQILRAQGVFDPVLTGSFTNERRKTPSNDALAGADTVVQLSQPARFGYAQTLSTGTQYTASFNASKSSSNSGFQNFNPALTSNLGLSFSQPLLRNRGRFVNRLNIMVAQSRLRKAEYDTRTQMLTLLTDAETAYWNLIQARENLRVRVGGAELAKKALERAQRELELGALSPLDIFNPEQQYATAKIEVSQAEFNLRQSEDALRRQMGADLDPDARKLPIVLTEDVMPGVTATIDAEKQVEKALAIRPDLKSALQSLDVDELSIRSATNAMKPELALTGNYISQGRGGNFYQRSNIFGENGNSTIINMLPGGFGNALDQMFGFGYPVYSFGLTLRLPIRNRAASADYADAVISKRRNALAVRSVEQQVRLDVLNAVNQVESSKAAVELAVQAREYAQKYLDAEQKKYELGTSQLFFVLQAQDRLQQAEAAVVQNSVSYRRNLLNLLRRTGDLLEERGVAIK